MAIAALLRTAPATAAAVTERLLSLPDVAMKFAKQLVAAGMRIKSAKLLAAANSMVAGVEVWVQAQQALGVNTDIPAVAVAICCGNTNAWVSSSQARQNIADLVPKTACVVCSMSSTLVPTWRLNSFQLDI
jgi:hypothetical protein